VLFSSIAVFVSVGVGAVVTVICIELALGVEID